MNRAHVARATLTRLRGTAYAENLSDVDALALAAATDTEESA